MAQRAVDSNFLKRIWYGLAVSGFLIFAVTPWINPGFIAMDDYSSLTRFYIPAQAHSVSEVLKHSEIRSPIPRLVLLGVAKLLHAAGVENPMLQYKIVLTLIGLFAFGIFFLFLPSFFPFSDDPNKTVLATALLGFFFFSPFLFTRLMIESLSAPLLFASGALCCQYLRTPRVRLLIASIIFLTAASIFRVQSGVCLLGILFIVLKKDVRHLLPVGIAGILLFVGTGLLDLWLRGSFHLSLISYLRFNFYHSSDFGRTPFYTYLALLFAVTLPPTLVSRYRGFSWKLNYSLISPAVFFFAIFVLSHTLVPHKEDRFMIPIVPIFIVLMVPLLEFFRKTIRWRFYYFSVTNLLLLIITITSAPSSFTYF